MDSLHEPISTGGPPPAPDVARPPRAAAGHRRAWTRHSQSAPALETITLTCGDRRLDLARDLQSLHAYFRDRPADSFLVGELGDQLTAKDARRGREVRDGRITFENFEATSFPSVPDWSENPFSDRNWEWGLHSLIVLRYLLAAHAETGDPWYLRHAEDLTLGWMRANIAVEPPSGLSWHDHATALRLENLLLLFEHGRARESGPEFLRGLLVLVYVHCHLLSEDTFYTPNSNHGLDQSRILFWAASVFPEFDDAPRWRAIGRERTAREIRQAFTAEGVHVENSPAYHFRLLGRALHADRIFRAYDPTPLFEGVEALAERALEFAAFIVQPDGRLPIIGDTSGKRAASSAAIDRCSSLPSYAYFRYSLTSGREGTPPPAADRVYPRSGYAILRDRWHQAEDFSDTVYLLFKAGFLSTFHRHDDDLSFILHAFGEDWIIDSGLYRYEEGDPLRAYMRSSRGHNVVLIDDLEPGRHADDRGKSRIESHLAEGDHVSVSASHDLYPGVRMERRIEYHKPRLIHLHDTVVPADGVEHVFRALFHVPVDKEISFEGDSVRLGSRTSSRALRITPRAGLAGAPEIISGQMEPEPQGWISSVFGELSPSTCLVWSARATRLESLVELTFE